MINAVKEFFTRYFDFKGRTNRKDFWLAILGIFLLSVVIGFVTGFLGGLLGDNAAGILGFVTLLWELAVIIPGLAIEVRRLHDIGKSGWWLLIGLIPFGGIVLLVFYCMDSK